ncbi:MAG: hypothetical protein KJ749_03010 [Planctomycetes bacterium]|nr:hypothetical protein [Planctomycetota bacterium]
MKKRHTLRIVAAFAAVVAFTAMPAQSDLIAIGPFTGDLTEDWESFPTTPPEGPYLPNPTSIMEGAASLSNPFLAIYEPGVRDFGLGSSGNATISDGTKGLGIEKLMETAVISFEEPVLRFGAYWGAWTNIQVGGDPALVTISFFDEVDALVATEVFEYSRSEYEDGVLEWHGWSSTIPIHKITCAEDKLVMDGLQADPVPEPAAASLLILGALLLLRPRQH